MSGRIIKLYSSRDRSDVELGYELLEFDGTPEGFVNEVKDDLGLEEEDDLLECAESYDNHQFDYSEHGNIVGIMLDGDTTVKYEIFD